MSDPEVCSVAVTTKVNGITPQIVYGDAKLGWYITNAPRRRDDLGCYLWRCGTWRGYCDVTGWYVSKEEAEAVIAKYADQDQEFDAACAAELETLEP